MSKTNGQFGFMFESEQEVLPELMEEVAEEIIDPPEELKEQVSIEEEREIVEQKVEDNGQIALMDIGEWWEEHWKQMPEFVQKDLEPWKSINVHFECREDMEAFAKLVGQQVNLTTKFIWYPKAEISHYVKCNRRYEDGSQIPDICDQ